MKGDGVDTAAELVFMEQAVDAELEDLLSRVVELNERQGFLDGDNVPFEMK